MDVEVPSGMENRPPHVEASFTGEAEYMNQFTDQDFQYSAAQFDTDYLENMSSRENTASSSLARESLFVKFDPLVGKPVASSPSVVDKPRANRELSPSNDIYEIREELPKANADSVASHDLLVMDTPPKQAPPPTVHGQGAGKSHPLQDSHVAPRRLDLDTVDSHMSVVTQSGGKGYTEDQVEEMLEAAKKEEIDLAQRKYAPELASLEKEFAAMAGKPGQVYDECMYVDSILSSQQNLLETELTMYKRLVTEHEQLETLMVYCHEKFKEKFLLLAEQRDSTLKSEKFKVKSFEELQKRYLKLQDVNRKLYKSQCSLATIKGKNADVTAELNRVCEDCLLKQDGLNQSYESTQKEMSSKLAVERAQTKTTELQVKSLEKDLEQKEKEKQQLTQIAEELMKELRNSE